MASIAVDVMSGDSGAQECVPGALRALAADPSLELILVGNPAIIEPELAAATAEVRARATVHAAATVVGMSEHPRDAIRRRKDSSMRLAIDLVKEGRAQGMVSAGNPVRLNGRMGRRRASRVDIWRLPRRTCVSSGRGAAISVAGVMSTST